MVEIKRTLSNKGRLLAAAALAASISGGEPAGAASGDPLAEFQWRKRVVLLFAPNATTSLAEQAKDLLSDKSGLAERDIVIVAVRGTTEVETVFGDAPGPAATASALRRHFQVAETAGFTAVLVGKDGGEKLRETHPIRRDALYAVIDAMPMRRNEARPRDPT